RAEVALHAIRMKAALREWERHDVGRAEAILAEVPAEFWPTYEYRHLRGLCRRKMMTLRGHVSSVTAVAYSPDGSRVTSGSQDGTLTVWDARTGQCLLTLEGNKGSVASVAYSPDGSRLASGTWDGVLKLWDARTGRELLTLHGHGSGVTAVAYSP